VQRLKGRSSAGVEFTIGFFIALTTFPLAGWGGAVLANGYWDESATATHHVPAVSRSYSSSKNSYTYYIHVHSWREGETTEALTVSHSMYSNVQLHKDEFAVETKAGYLGYEWLVKYRNN
jgi:hypothetical protein